MEINSLSELKDLYQKSRKRGKARVKNYQSCSCDNGHLHHSRGEAKYCNQLHFIKKAGEITEIETQVHFDLKVNGIKIIGHRPDFRVTYADGRQEIHEFKGFETERWVIAKRLFNAIHPDIPYIVIKPTDLW